MRARSMEYLRTDLADDMQKVRRRHLVTNLFLPLLEQTRYYFRQSEKMDDDDWEEMRRIKKKETQSSPPKQFYFGMTPDDVGIATVPPPPALDIDEESRRVTEEFDAVLNGSRTKSEKDPLETIVHGGLLNILLRLLRLTWMMTMTTMRVKILLSTYGLLYQRSLNSCRASLLPLHGELMATNRIPFTAGSWIVVKQAI